MVGRRSTNPKVVGSNSTPVGVFGLRLLALAWRNTLSFRLKTFHIQIKIYSEANIFRNNFKFIFYSANLHYLYFDFFDLYEHKQFFVESRNFREIEAPRCAV